MTSSSGAIEAARCRLLDRGFRRLESIDAHTAGEPLRVIVSGYPDLVGATLLERRRAAKRDHDALRRALILEPRGHADMYGCLLLEPDTDDADFAVLFLHNEGYSTMCGHGIIGVVTVGLECGLLEPRDPEAIQIDTPAGRVVAHAHRQEDRVVAVSFRNVPSFVFLADQTVDVPGLGPVRYDLAFGGAFYACVELAANPSLGALGLGSGSHDRLLDLGRRIKTAVAAATPPRHPGAAGAGADPDLDFVYGTIFVGDDPRSGVHSRNVCVFADGEVDRSPTGTGVSARAALLHERGELRVGEWIKITSILGTSFDVRVVGTTTAGGLAAVVPEVRGSAHVIGLNEHWIDPADELAEGFLLR